MRSEELIQRSLEGCTEPQQQAIRHIDGPLLVLAGPGSGKTRVITRRIGHLVGSGVRPHDVLAVTFTNKAAGEMGERVTSLGVPDGVWVSTFHSFCARMLRIYGEQVGLKPGFSIYDTDDSIAAIKTAMQEAGVDSTQFKPSFAARQISSAKNKLWTPQQIRNSGGPAGTLAIASVYEKYDAILRASNAVDFDDLLIMMVRLLQEGSEIAGRLTGRYRYVLVDEYQDTNHSQYLIAKHLAAAHGNLCVTGDPDQSIYAWRGADINNILEFEKDYPNAQVVRLERNYRSTKAILRSADAVIENNVARKVKALWTENVEGEAVQIIRREDEKEEAFAIAEDIARRIKDGMIAPRDAAVFYRLNAHSRVLEAAMRREALPYTIVAGTEFYQRREIKDLIAYLRLVVNPDDEVSLDRVINVPTRGIGAMALEKLRFTASTRGRGLAQTLAGAADAGLRGPALKGIAEFRGILAALAAMPPRPVAPIVQKLIELTNFEKHLKAGDDAEERIANIGELVNAAAEYDQAEPEGGLVGFLEQAALISDVDAWDEEVGGVTLMTLHAAKGLEFSAVYVTGLEEGVLPLTRDNGDHDIEEERRLFFVGMTRAKKFLTLTYAEARTKYGKTEYAEPSRFIAELPEEVREQLPPPPRLPLTGRAFWGGGHGFVKPRPFTPKPATTYRTVQRDNGEQIVYDADVPPATVGVHFKEGDTVIHPAYGRGKIISVSGFGDSARAQVRFPVQGVKSFILKHAHLKKER